MKRHLRQIFLKDRSLFLALPKIRGTFKLTYHITSIVNRSVETFPPLYVLFLNANVLMDRTRKTKSILVGVGDVYIFRLPFDIFVFQSLTAVEKSLGNHQPLMTHSSI